MKYHRALNLLQAKVLQDIGVLNVTEHIDSIPDRALIIKNITFIVTVEWTSAIAKIISCIVFMH